MVGLWTSYTWDGSGLITPASFTGVVGLGFVGLETGKITGYIEKMAVVSIPGYTPKFNVIDLTETAESPNNNTSYRGGLQSIDKSFSASPILVPQPLAFPVSYDIGFIESAVITLSGIWFDGLHGRDAVMEDIRTGKTLISENYVQSPLVFLVSNRAYFVQITGYSSNLVGGQGDILSFRLGLSICSGNGHYV